MRREPLNFSFLGTFTHYPPDYLSVMRERLTFPVRETHRNTTPSSIFSAVSHSSKQNFDPGRDRNGADVPTLAIEINNGPVVISLLKVA